MRMRYERIKNMKEIEKCGENGERLEVYGKEKITDFSRLSEPIKVTIQGNAVGGNRVIMLVEGLGEHIPPKLAKIVGAYAQGFEKRIFKNKKGRRAVFDYIDKYYQNRRDLGS